MRLIFEQIRTGGDRNFAYLVGDREAKRAAIIDPSYDPEAVVGRAGAQGLTIDYIINTHAHNDHINGNELAKELCGAPIAAYCESSLAPEAALEDEATVNIGSFVLRFLHTPGHSDDHLVVVVENEHIAVTGDLLFVGKVGGTAGREAAEQEWQSLRRIVTELSFDTTIWPGHDYGCRPSSTIGLERRTNPFLEAECFDDFNRLKEDWPQFKAEHGLT